MLVCFHHHDSAKQFEMMMNGWRTENRHLAPVELHSSIVSLSITEFLVYLRFACTVVAWLLKCSFCML